MAAALGADRAAAFDLTEPSGQPPAAVDGQDTGELGIELEAARGEIRRLRQALAAAEAAAGANADQAAALGMELALAEQRVALAETLAEASRQRAVDLSIATAEALSRARSVEQRLAGTEQALSEAERGREEAEAALADLAGTIDRATAQAVANIEQADLFEDRLAELEVALTEANAAIAGRDDRIAALDAEVAAARRELATYDALHREAQQAMTQLAIEAAAIDYQLQSVLLTGSTAALPDREEIMAWQAVVLNDTPEAYREYLTRYPDGEFIREARRRLGNVLSRRVAAVPFEPSMPTTEGTGPDDRGAEAAADDEAAVGDDADVAAAGDGAPDAPPDASDTHVVQLVSVLTMDEATSEWERLRNGYPDLLGALQPFIDEVDLGDGGTWFRVQGGPLSRADADALCTDLIGRGAECIVRAR